MPPDTPQAGKALQGTSRPSRPDGADGTLRPDRFDWTDWRDWVARCLWTLRAARDAWATWAPGSLRSGGTDRPDRAVGQRGDHDHDGDHDDHLHPPPAERCPRDGHRILPAGRAGRRWWIHRRDLPVPGHPPARPPERPADGRATPELPRPVHCDRQLRHAHHTQPDRRRPMPAVMATTVDCLEEP